MKTSRTEGYALVEVLISAAIVAMALVTCIGSFHSVSHGMKKADAVNRQLREARNIAARLRSRAGVPEAIEANWLVTKQLPLTGTTLERYKIAYRHQPSLTFFVDVFKDGGNDTYQP